MTVLGLRFCARAFSSCGKRGPLFITVRGPLTIAASLAAEHRLQTCRLSNCGSRAQLLRSMWDLPRPGLEPVSLHWQADSQPLRHQGSPCYYFLICKQESKDSFWFWIPFGPCGFLALCSSDLIHPRAGWKPRGQSPPRDSSGSRSS